MNLKFLFLTILSASIFIGCSTENEEGMIIESANYKLNKDNLSQRVINRPFKSRASGNWFIVESTDCNGLLQYSITGIGNATHMGLIDIEGKICTYPPDNLYFLTVKYKAANGDELIWESVSVNFNEDGLFEGGLFECVGGSGRFSDAEGNVSINEILTVTSLDETTGLPLAGTFSNIGFGNITY